LGSGSKGNATIVQSANTMVLIDCGFSISEIDKRMARQNLDPQQIEAILVTHEHWDHMGGVFPLARRYRLPVYLTAGTAAAAKSTKGVPVELIDAHKKFEVGEIDVSAIAVPHDAREPVQFVLTCQGKSLGVLTDLGSITSHVVESYRQCDGLLLEANHDRTMLAEGPYPYPLKRRVGGDWGHLNNEQAADLLGRLDLGRIQGLVMGHISEKNNCLDAVKRSVGSIVDDASYVQYATQYEGTSWLSLN
jgi:phosphoribosyl 1,2-cyclic phosphodiesterase